MTTDIIHHNIKYKFENFSKLRGAVAAPSAQVPPVTEQKKIAEDSNSDNNKNLGQGENVDANALPLNREVEKPADESKDI